MGTKKSLILPLISLIFIFGLFGVVGAVVSSITVTSPNGGEFWGETQQITWTAVGSGGDFVDIYYNSGSGNVLIAPFQLFNAGSFSWDTTSVSNGGNYKIIVTASSNPGINDVSNNFFTVDNTAPVVSVDAVTTPTNSDTQTITGTFTETNIDTIIVNGVSATIGGGTYSAANVPLSEGTNTITATATDLAGNTGEDSETIFLDTVDPTTSDDYDFNDAWVNSDQTITLTPTDPSPSSGIVWTRYCLTDSCDPSTGTDYSSSVLITTEGTTHFRYASKDNAGNVQSTKEQIVKIDKTNPVANAGVDQTVDEDVNVIFNAVSSSDSLSLIVSYEWDTDASDGVDFGTPDLTGVNPTLTGGYETPKTSYIVTLKVTDNAGNSNTDTLTVTVNDVTPPTVSVTGEPIDWTVSPTGGIADSECSDNVACDSATEAYQFHTNALDNPPVCSSTYSDYTIISTTLSVTQPGWVCAAVKDDTGNEGFSSSPVYFKSSTTIQGAIDAASSGDTIQVSAGTYNEAVVVNKGVTLIGDIGDSAAGPGINAPILDGQDTLNDAFTISPGVSGVTIEGFEIKNYVGPGNGVGNAIQAWNSGTSNVVIRDNHMHNLDWNGVLVGNDGALGDHDNWVIKNNILGNYGAYGLELTNARNSVIEDNIVTASTSWTGVVIVARRNEFNITIQNNKISGIIDSGSDGRAAIYVLAWDVETVDVNLNDVKIQNNEITTTGTKPHIRFFDVGTGTITNAVVNNNILLSLTNNAVAEVNAEDNWWGDLDPSDQIIGDVDFTPWAYNVNVDTDNIVPTTTIDSPLESSWFNGDFDVGLTDSDTGGSGLALCRYRVRSWDGSNYVATKNLGDRTCSQPVNLLVGLTSENHCETEGIDACKIEVFAIDNSGNQGTEVSRTFSIDLTDPTINTVVVTTPTETATQTITGTFTEINIATITVNGVEAVITGNDYSAENVPLTEGTNTIIVIATDLAGNSVTDNSNSITLDTLLPEITGLSDFGVEIDSSISVTATVTDANGIASVTLHYTVEGESELTEPMTPSGDDYTGSIPSQSSSTTISYFVVAQDNAGNLKTSSTFTITVNDLIWELDSAWNLVSVPKTLDNKDVGILLPGSGVFRYNAETGIWEQGISDFNELNPGEGYWVDNNGDNEVGLDYAADCTGPECFPSETIILGQGWNLIGHMCTSPQNVEVAVPPSTYDNLFVLRYDEASNLFQIYATQDSGNAQFPQMVPGEGYWVFVPEGDLAYTNLC